MTCACHAWQIVQVPLGQLGLGRFDLFVGDVNDFTHGYGFAGAGQAGGLMATSSWPGGLVLMSMLPPWMSNEISWPSLYAW